MSAGASGEIVSVWDAINAYAAVWRHPEYTGVDRQKAVVTVGTAIDALVARKVAHTVETIYSSIESEIDAGAGEFDGGLNLALDIINRTLPTPPPATRG